MLIRRSLSGTLLTKDGLEISFEHNNNDSDALIIICPGFFNSKDNRWMRKSVELVSSEYDALIFDFRGHGKSKGKFSWLSRESNDLEAVLGYARGKDYKHIGILAYSLGAAAAVIALAKQKHQFVKSAVLISTPYDFWKINYHFWEPEMFCDLKDNFDCDWEGKGARVGNIFTLKPKPLDEVGKIKQAQLLFIHGSKDWIIKDKHSRKLFDAAQTTKQLEIIEGGLHAERLLEQHPQRMENIIHGWFAQTLKTGGAD